MLSEDEEGVDCMTDLRYSEIVDVYERVESTTKRLEMTSLLVELLRKSPKESIDKVVYLTQGKLYPDFVGLEIGVAEKLAIKALAIVAGKSEDIVEEKLKELGDLGKVAEDLVARKAQQSLFHQPLTVGVVYDAFDKMAKATGSGSVDVKVRYLTRLLNDASPKEARYILRTAVGRLRLGVADMTILDALSEAFGRGKVDREIIEKAYNLSSDLGLVAKTLAYEGMEGLRKFKITIGRPIRPMLAERLSDAREILDKLGGRGAAEYKYDGIRIQAHIGPDATYLFSRRLEDITSQFPDVCRYLKDSIDASEAVVEGECVAFEADTGEMLPFQVISQRRGRKYDVEKMSEEIPVKIFLFDLLYLNGEDYTMRGYTERRRALESIVTSTDRVGLSHLLITSDPEELDRYMDQAISEGCEGLVVKSVGEESIYKAGARGWLWIKYKRSYKAEVADTFDLVVVGAFKGRGKRAGSYGALLMAVYNHERDVFETLCKLGSGFTDEDLAGLPKLLEPYRIERKHPRVDSLMEPDLWFTPEMVLEVAADEITLSPMHTCSRDEIKRGAGLALRFPRFTGRYRRDKGPEDATTSTEVMELYRRQLKQIA
ncbi:MAG: ATP-dependent DNA ligase [Candidatus Bathyarchaeia archaeon]